MSATDWQDATAAAPCEICGHGDWCSRNGTKLVCRRQAEHLTFGRGAERTDSGGAAYWLFTRPGTAQPKRPEPTLRPSPDRADADTLNRVYSALLKALPWAPEAVRELHRRGLTPQQIAETFRGRFGYAWLPERGRAAAVRKVVDQFGETAVTGVPGFVVREHDGSRYWTIGGKSGLLIPVRDAEGRIVALKVRAADGTGSDRYRYLTSKGKSGGAGPGSPVHFPAFTGDRATVRVTEGPLKADIATLKSGVLTIGLPGVGSWKLAAGAAQALGAARVLVAFDADWRTNPAVAKSIESLIFSLQEKGLQVVVETWDADAGKGIDDVLLSGREVLQTEPREVLQAIAPAAADGATLEAADDPHRLARLCLPFLPPLRYWRGEFYGWESPAYRLLAADELRATITGLVKAEFDRLAEIAAKLADPETDKETTTRKVTKALVSEVLDKLAALSIVPHRLTLPAWLADAPEWPANQCLVTKSGILPVPSLNSDPLLIEPTPDLFTVNALEFAFDPEAKCPQWLAFLSEIWREDPESIECLQEIVGYLLLPETKFQKMFMLIGPRRSGKGTISRIIKHVCGPANVCAPTLGSLAGEFGLQPLLGKTVAIIGDARLSGRQDSGMIVERLLSITGEDLQTVNRKHQAQVTDTLPCRFVLNSNELPKLSDASATLPSRMVLLCLTESFYGREDHNLTERLITEAPGILNWALRGWQRLHARGHFIQPERSKELMADLETLSSPITAFIRERCIVEPGAQVEVRDVFKEWSNWCEAKGRRSGSEQSFGRDLRAAVPSVRVTQPRIEGKQVRHYEGIRVGW